MPDIAQVFRDRVRALGITYAAVDAIAGLADGYTAKVLSNPPQNDMGTKAMVLIAGALGICFVPISSSAGVHDLPGRRLRSVISRSPSARARPAGRRSVILLLQNHPDDEDQSGDYANLNP
jgi:hypothetical protein